MREASWVPGQGVLTFKRRWERQGAGRDIQSPSPEQGAKWKANPKCIVGPAAILSVSVPPNHFPGDDDRLPIPEGTWSPIVFVTLGGHSVLWEPAKSIVFRAGLTIE